MISHTRHRDGRFRAIVVAMMAALNAACTVLGPLENQLASEQATTAYATYVTGYFNKAFVATSQGGYGYAFQRETIEAAIEGAFARCRQHPRNDCLLYDVNGVRVNAYREWQALKHIDEIRAGISATKAGGGTDWRVIAVGCQWPSDGDGGSQDSSADALSPKSDPSRDETGAASSASRTGDRLSPPPRTIADISATIRSEQFINRDRYAACRALTESAVPSNEGREALIAYFRARGLAAFRLGKLRQHIDDSRTAVSLARETSMPPDAVGWLLLDLSAAEYQGGNLSSAIEHRIEALGMISNARSGKASWVASLARLYAERGEISQADVTSRHARELFEATRSADFAAGGDGFAYAFLLLGEATILRTKGQFSIAEGRSREGLVVMSRIPPGPTRQTKHFEALINLLHLELSLSLLGQTRLTEAEIEARIAFERALQLHGPMSAQTGFQLTNGLIPVLMEQERYEDTMELANATVTMYAALGAGQDSWLLANVRGRIAESLVYQRQWLSAVEHFDDIRAGLARDPATFERYFADQASFNLALIKAGRAEEALRQLETSLKRKVAFLGDDNYATAEVRGALAMALAANGEPVRAAAEFQLAVPVLVSSLDLTDGVGTARRRRAQLILEGYIDFVIDRSFHTPRPEIKTDLRAEAFRIADVVRAQSVTRAIAGSAARSVPRDPKLSDLARREQELQRQFDAQLRLLVGIAGSEGNDRSLNAFVQLRRQVDDLRVQRASVREELELRYPEYFRLVAPVAPTVARARESLRSGETLLSTYTTDDKTYVWAIPKEGEMRFAIASMGSTELTSRVAKLRLALELPGTMVSAVPAYDIEAAHALYDALLKPVEDAWRDATTILAVPFGALAQLPLGLLPVTASDWSGGSDVRYRNVPWLIRRHALAVFPSAASLVSVRQSGAASSPSRPFVGFGDPVFQGRADEGYVRTNDAARGAEPGLRHAPQLRKMSSARLEMLPALPETAEEIRSIAKALGADLSRDVHLREDASEATLQKLNDSGDLSRYRVISFATHGLIPNDLDGLTEPALALTNPEISGGNGDGLLTMGEVLSLRLDADWVVLSACNTAAGEGKGATAFSGLGRAFFYAGARALLVSNWPVETTSAKSLMTDVFQRWAANPSISRAEALRLAMVAMLDQGKFPDVPGRTVVGFAHPIFWAPFMLVGDPGDVGSRSVPLSSTTFREGSEDVPRMSVNDRVRLSSSGDD